MEVGVTVGVKRDRVPATQTWSTRKVTAAVLAPSVWNLSPVAWERAWDRLGGLAMEPQDSRVREVLGMVINCHWFAAEGVKLKP